MKLIVLLLTIAAAQVFAQVGPGPIVLDDFTAPRTNSKNPPPADDNRLWREGFPNCDLVDQVAGGFMYAHAIVSPSNCGTPAPGQGLGNILFFPANESGWPYNTPCTQANNCQLLQGYAKVVPNGTDWTTVNRVYFTLQTDTNEYPFNAGRNIEIGTFIKYHGDTTTNDQGTHYYHQISTGIYAGQTLYFVLNRKVQHSNVDPGGSTDHPEDPEWNKPYGAQPVHYFDGMTTFYFDAGPSTGSWMGNFQFGPFTMGSVTSEPDDHVANITGTYTGPNASAVGQPNNVYQVTWASPKNIPGGERYQLYYSTAGSMHTNGLSSGTSGGTITGFDNSGYTNLLWNSPSMAKTANLWVAIRPQLPILTVTSTSPITVQTGTIIGHWLNTGDSVTIAGLCAAANGTRTVTVIDRYTVSLGVSGTCTYSGYTGPSSGTMTATSNTTNFSEILIGPGGGSTQTFSPCDLNQDGVVNNLDYNLSISQALGQASCTANINGTGVCNVVTVQRVANAASTGVCKTGP